MLMILGLVVVIWVGVGLILGLMTVGMENPKFWTWSELVWEDNTLLLLNCMAMWPIVSGLVAKEALERWWHRNGFCRRLNFRKL